MICSDTEWFGIGVYYEDSFEVYWFDANGDWTIVYDNQID
jgi:hypothetical protein